MMQADNSTLPHSANPGSTAGADPAPDVTLRSVSRRAGWWLFATLATLYALSMVRVDFDFAIDGALRYETLHFLIEHGMATIPQLAGYDDKFFVGASVAMAPRRGRAAITALATSSNARLVNAMAGTSFILLCTSPTTRGARPSTMQASSATAPSWSARKRR